MRVPFKNDMLGGLSDLDGKDIRSDLISDFLKKEKGDNISIHKEKELLMREKIEEIKNITADKLLDTFLMDGPPTITFGPEKRQIDKAFSEGSMIEFGITYTTRGREIHELISLIPSSIESKGKNITIKGQDPEKSFKHAIILIRNPYTQEGYCK